METMQALYQTVLSRRAQKTENSYTCYLFSKGTDKILKKVGEECAEVIIAAKNEKKEDTVNEICDLAYHVLVLMAEQGIAVEDVAEVLEERRKKIGNLKKFHKTDRNS